MNEPFFDNITDEAERLRLWKLYHQYSRPTDAGYRIQVVRKLIILHGGSAHLPGMNECQKKVMEEFYVRNHNHQATALKIGIRASLVCDELERALSILENCGRKSEHSAIVPIKAARPVSQKTVMAKSGIGELHTYEARQSPPIVSVKTIPCHQRIFATTPYSMPASRATFWSAHDCEGSWRRKREMMRVYLTDADESTWQRLSEGELPIIRGLIMDGRDASSIAQECGVALHTINNLYRHAIDSLRIGDGYAPRYRKAPKRESQSHPHRHKSELRGEEMMVEYLSNRGSKRLRDDLVHEWTPLIHYVIKHRFFIEATRFDYEDYVSMGMIGLLEAIDSYDDSHESGANFKTHAMNRITYALHNGIKEELGMRNAMVRAEHVKIELRNINQAEQRGECDERMQRRKEKLLDKIDNLHQSIRPDSLDRPLRYRNDDIAVCLVDIIVDRQTTDDQAETDIQLETLAQHMSVLTEQESAILYYCYYEDLSLSDIGKRTGGMRNEAVQVAIDHALRKLKSALFGYGEDLSKTATYGLPRGGSCNCALERNTDAYVSAYALLTHNEQRAIECIELQGLTLQVAGNHIGVTRERVRQLLVRAHQKLARYLTKHRP